MLIDEMKAHARAVRERLNSGVPFYEQSKPIKVVNVRNRVWNGRNVVFLEDRDWLLVSSEMQSEEPRWRIIAREVATKYRVTLEEMQGTKRSQRFIRPRYEAYARIYDETDLTVSQIGKHFNRDHTTICHGLRKAGIPCKM